MSVCVVPYLSSLCFPPGSLPSLPARPLGPVPVNQSTCGCQKWGTGTLTPFICVFVNFVYVFDCIILYCLLTRSYGCENTDT